MTTAKQVNLSDDPEQLKQQLARLSKAERHAFLEQAKAQLARTDFIAYNRYVHNWQLEPHHIEWMNILQSHPRACIIAPPESGKSRLMRSWLEWNIGQDPNIALMLIQNTGRQTGLQVAAIGNVLKDPKYQRVFPAIKATDRWSGEKIFIDRTGLPMEFRTDATLSGYGIDGAYQGAHVDGEIIDDPTDQKDVYSAGVMQIQRDLMKGVLLDRLNEFRPHMPEVPGFWYGIMTRWGDDDLLSAIELDMRIPIFTFPAYRDEPYPWGSNYLSEKQYSEMRLKELEITKGPDLFKLAYLCSASGAVRGTRIFPTLHKSLHLKPMSDVVQSVGVSAGAEGVDWGTTQAHQSAIVAVHKLYNGMLVVRGAWQSPSGSSAELLSKANQFRESFGMLNNAWIDRSQGSLRDQFKYQLGMGAWKGEASVEYRIGVLRTALANNLFVIDSEGPGVTELWNQLTSYAKDDTGRVIERNDDLIDALLYAVAALHQPIKRGVGPMVEIVPGEDDQPMADAYHDNFDPANFDADGTTRKNTMGDYSNLV